jgi:hypothetical protein
MLVFGDIVKVKRDAQNKKYVVLEVVDINKPEPVYDLIKATAKNIGYVEDLREKEIKKVEHFFYTEKELILVGEAF